FFICFFFSSRRRHTRSKRDWSSDVCSSDLYAKDRELSGSRSFASAGICSVLEFALIWPVVGRQWANQGVIATLFDNVCGPSGDEIGRASCRERVWVSVGAGDVQNRGRRTR